MIKIGYQGMEGSNSEEAALIYVEENYIKEYELVPLISSKNVINSLENKEIDLGVLAVKNSTAGDVLETKEALKNKENNFDTIFNCSINIKHSLFKKKEVDLKDLKYIASHPQALKQTKNNRKEKYNNLIEIEVEDTAIAAKYLANNNLNELTAVICKKKAGLMYNLDLIEDNISDNDDNTTYFSIIKNK